VWRRFCSPPAAELVVAKLSLLLKQIAQLLLLWQLVMSGS